MIWVMAVLRGSEEKRSCGLKREREGSVCQCEGKIEGRK
jgi:hypothetical protein